MPPAVFLGTKTIQWCSTYRSRRSNMRAGCCLRFFWAAETNTGLREQLPLTFRVRFLISHLKRLFLRGMPTRLRYFFGLPCIWTPSHIHPLYEKKAWCYTVRIRKNNKTYFDRPCFLIHRVFRSLQHIGRVLLKFVLGLASICVRCLRPTLLWFQGGGVLKFLIYFMVRFIA